MAASPRARDSFRILIIDDSQDSKIAERALEDKNLSFIKRKVAAEPEETCRKVPCLIAGEGRFSGRQMISEYADAIDEQVKKGL